VQVSCPLFISLSSSKFTLFRALRCLCRPVRFHCGYKRGAFTRIMTINCRRVHHRHHRPRNGDDPASIGPPTTRSCGEADQQLRLEQRPYQLQAVAKVAQFDLPYCYSHRVCGENAVVAHCSPGRDAEHAAGGQGEHSELVVAPAAAAAATAAAATATAPSTLLAGADARANWPFTRCAGRCPPPPVLGSGDVAADTNEATVAAGGPGRRTSRAPGEGPGGRRRETAGRPLPPRPRPSGAARE